MDSWFLCQLTPDAAMEHDRRVCNVSDPHVKIGWKPYTFRATHNAVAVFACHTDDELANRLKQHNLKIDGWREWREGVRSTRLSNA